MTSNASADGLVRLRIADPGSERMVWCEGLVVSFPRDVLEATGLSNAIDRGGALRIPSSLPPIGARLVDELRLRAAFTPDPPASARLPFSYRVVPGPLRRLAANVMGRRQRRHASRWAAFPGWPIDVSADVLADLASPDVASSGPVPVVLTHDIDSQEGLRNLVDLFLPVEENVGARSTNFIVPCAWPLDDGLLREAHRRGHQLGIHGYDHANRTPFAGDAERQARLDAARPLKDQFAMIGYRAPSLLRTRELLADLAPRYQYDSSIPTSGGLFPVPNNGCASARPFRLGGLVEIPISLPRDGSLRFLGHTPAAILEMWKACAGIVARARGTVVLLTHCESHFSGNAPMRDTYRGFLEWVRSDARFAFATPTDVLARI